MRIRAEVKFKNAYITEFLEGGKLDDDIYVK